MSLNLPIRFKKLNASVREAELRLDSIKFDRIEKENRIISLLESAVFKFKDYKRIINLYRDSLIPKAQQAFEVTKTAFSTGKAGFLDFIDTQRTLLDFELILEKAKSSYFQNIALIEKIIGKNLQIRKERLIQE
jgi:outer membrane protein TolC